MAQAETAAKAKKPGLHIFINRTKVEVDSSELTGSQLLIVGGFEGQEWDLFELKGEGDPSGGTLILADQEVALKEGERFRVIPGNRTFGS